MADLLAVHARAFPDKYYQQFRDQDLVYIGGYTIIPDHTIGRSVDERAQNNP
jgi:hypothetical protein